MFLVTAHQLFGQVREVDQDRHLADQLCNLPAGNDSPQGLLHVEAGLIGGYLPRMPARSSKAATEQGSNPSDFWRAHDNSRSRRSRGRHSFPSVLLRINV